MIDFLFKNYLSAEDIYYFLSKIFDIDKGKIAVVHIDEFNDVNSNIVLDNLSCLCVYSEISGDALLLAQLYRYSIDEDYLIKKISETAAREKIPCYIPADNFDGWILLGCGSEQIKGKQVHSDDSSIFYFEMI